MYKKGLMIKGITIMPTQLLLTRPKITALIKEPTCYTSAEEDTFSPFCEVY